MMNPEMMKAAQDMMAKMSPEDMQKMMSMQQEMMKNPAMMQQAQQMMSNPAMAQQAAAQMKNMSAEDLKKQVDAASTALPHMAAAAPPPAAPVSATARLKASSMSVATDLVDAVEEAENAKALGNKKFKEADYAAAADKYTKGAELVDKALTKGKLSGADKKAVDELKEACHLNLANCRLKLKEWDLAITECDKVLAKGENRKARFRRGDALRELGKLQEAKSDLAAAVKMDPSDAVVQQKLRDVQKMLGEEDESPIIEDADSDEEEVDTSKPTGGKTKASGASGGGSSSSPMPPMGGMGGMPNVDPAQMDAMLDNLTPEQMQAQFDQLDNLTPEQMKMMGMPDGVDKNQLKAMSSMFKGMDKEQMKSMAKMAAQMRPQMEAMKAGGMGSGAGSSSGGGGGGAPAGMPDMSKMMNGEMGMDQGMDMLKNMSPDMMKAGMDMMKNMDPAMMKSMSKMMGREIDESQLEQMQKMMSDMKPEDMEKWAKRAQSVAGVAEKPMKMYKWVRGKLESLGYFGVLSLLVGLYGILAYGHYTDRF